MKFKRYMRLLMLILIIAMAAILPVPIKLNYKDELPTNLQEQVDTKDEEDEDNDIYEIS